MGSLMLDDRLLNVRRYYVGEPEELMQLAKEVTNTACYVCWEQDGGLRIAGTGFFVIEITNGHLHEMGQFAVTAAHVIDQVRSRRKKEVWLLTNSKSGGRTSIRIPLKEWVQHPTDKSVDVAVASLRWGSQGDADFSLILSDMALSPEELLKHGIRPGHGVFFTTVFPKHSGEKRVIPILRTGTIALMPDSGEPIYTKRGYAEAYLIECHSTPTSSGAPVYCGIDKILPPIIPPGEFIPAEDYKAEIRTLWAWLGLIHGHWDIEWDVDEKDRLKFGLEELAAVNTGVAVVVPAWKIMEVINQPKLLDMRKDKIKQLRERLAPTQDSVAGSKKTNRDVAIKEHPSKERFFDDLGKAIRKK
jgi:hypothetical protein